MYMYMYNMSSSHAPPQVSGLGLDVDALPFEFN